MAEYSLSPVLPEDCEKFDNEPFKTQKTYPQKFVFARMQFLFATKIDAQNLMMHVVVFRFVAAINFVSIIVDYSIFGGGSLTGNQQYSFAAVPFGESAS